LCITSKSTGRRNVSGIIVITGFCNKFKFAVRK